MSSLVASSRGCAGVEPIPFVHEALDRIPVPMCVASSGTIEKMRTTLGAAGLLERFEGRLFSASDVARAKPAPDVYVHAAQGMGALPARRAVVEDSPVGVQAGVAAGMTVFGYAAATSADALSAAGSLVFSDMRTLPSLLGFDLVERGKGRYRP